MRSPHGSGRRMWPNGPSRTGFSVTARPRFRRSRGGQRPLLASESRPRVGKIVSVVTVEDVRGVALTLPRTEEALVRDRVKFRVGRLVYIAFSRDEQWMGFAFPKEERA